MSTSFKRAYSSNIDVASRQSDALVFEFGRAYLRIGVAGECKPRRLIPLFSSSLAAPSNVPKSLIHASSSSLGDVRTTAVPSTVDDYWDSSCTFPRDLYTIKATPGYEDLGPWLRNLYTYQLLLKPRSRRVLVLLPIYHPHDLQKELERIFLTELEVPSILFTHPFETIPYAIGETSAGMIVDIGQNEGRIACFFNGDMCENTLQIVPIGYQVALKRIQEYNARQQGPHGHDKKDASSNDDHIKEMLMNDLFFDLDNVHSLIHAFLSCLLECPMDLRKAVVQHVVFVGGGVEGILSQLEKRFLSHIQTLFVERKKVACHLPNNSNSNNNNNNILQERTLYGIKDEHHKKFDPLATVIMTAPLGVLYPLPFRPSCMAWIGASIMGSLQTTTMTTSSRDRWIHRSDS